MNKLLKYTIVAVVSAAVLVVSNLISWNKGVTEGRARQAAEDLAALAAATSDTTVIRDTAWFDRPVPKKVEVVDTFFLASVDTIRLRDTVLLALPLERKVYEDSLYRATVSGYHPSLDEIEIFQATKFVTTVTHVTTKVKPRNSVAFEADIMYDSKFLAPMTLGYTRHWDNGFFLGGDGGYDFQTDSPVARVKMGYNLRF